MSRHVHVNRSAVKKTARLQQIAGMFDLSDNGESSTELLYELPSDGDSWNIGLIVGPSGSGKSTVLRKHFGDELDLRWNHDACVIDSFPDNISVHDIVKSLSAVGLSSPPVWMRAYMCLSNGEQFRCRMARAILESESLIVMDEFTSVVDRQVAQFGCHAIQKLVRTTNKRFVAAACHYDIIDWLQPDWVLDMASGSLAWRLLRKRPAINCEIKRVRKDYWQLFKKHHYLSHSLHKSAICFCLFVNSHPVAFTAAIHFPHAKRSGWKEHRTVCLPDFQGAGLGHLLSDSVASFFTATGKPYRSATTHPGMIHSRMRSNKWRILMKSQARSKIGKTSSLRDFSNTVSTTRALASFEYIGPTDAESAAHFGVIDWCNNVEK